MASWLAGVHAGSPRSARASRASPTGRAGTPRPTSARPGGAWLAAWQTAKGSATEVVGQDVGPAVAVDARGAALVTFSDAYEIYAQRVSTANARVGAGVRVSSMGPDGERAYEAYGPSVAFHPRAGSYLVAWTGNDAAPLTAGRAPKDAYGQHLSANGTPVGPDDFPLSAVSETDLGAETNVVADPRGREFIATSLDGHPDHNGEAGTFVRRVVAP